MGYRYVHQASVAVLSSSYRLCAGGLKPLATSKIAYPNSGSGHNEVLPGEKDSVQGVSKCVNVGQPNEKDSYLPI